MYYYDKEQQEKEIYEKCYETIVKSSNKMGLIVLSIIGSFIIILALILFFVEGEIMASIFLIGMGVFYIILGFLISLTSKIKPNYEKFKKRLNKSVKSTFDLNIRVAMLEEKNKLLEERIESLERRR